MATTRPSTAKALAPLLHGNEIANRILLAIPKASLERIRPGLQLIETKRRQVIDHVDGPIEHMYFVNRGLVSVVKVMQDGRSVEIGAVGVEGITDPSALFGIDRAVMETMVQIPGTAFRIRREALRSQMVEDAALRSVMQGYARFAYAQLGQSAACNRLHSLEERCCRWLLTAHDSALSDSFPLTHEYLAMMLGSQRPSVSITAHILKRAGLIDYNREVVTILDRDGLEENACECYASLRRQIDELFARRLG
jgi:CRP-like cAMP-binding protein